MANRGSSPCSPLNGGCAWLRSRRERRIWHGSGAPRAAGTPPGRDEGTGALIEPRNNREHAPWPCRHYDPSITVDHPMVGETAGQSHLACSVERWRRRMRFYGPRVATDSENQGKEANLSLEIPYAIALGETEHASHTEIRTLPLRSPIKPHDVHDLVILVPLSLTDLIQIKCCAFNAVCNASTTRSCSRSLNAG